MTTTSKRGFLQTSALMATGAVVGCATPGTATVAPATPFAVPATYFPIDKALELVYGYAVGLDMRRRDLQRGMGDQKRPWEIGKSFDHSAPLAPSTWWRRWVTTPRVRSGSRSTARPSRAPR